ncbi:MAG TPA: hypothetical protein VEZ46_17990 [Mycobacteriales bacterium]|nr:hypothetical protein [Mycobacteriales bacterium]
MTEATQPEEVRDAPQTSSNQAKTEPIPPSPAADPPDFVPGGDRAGDSATATEPGESGAAPTGDPAVGTARNDNSGESGNDPNARGGEGAPPLETRPTVDTRTDASAGGRVGGRPDSDTDGEAARPAPDSLGEAPAAFETDPEANVANTVAAMGGSDSPVPAPGFISDEHGHVAVSTHAAQGTSEELAGAEGIRTTAIAQPGKPDGEVAT